MLPDLKCFKNGKQFLFVDIIVEFRWCEGVGMKEKLWRGWWWGHSPMCPFQWGAETPESSVLGSVQWWRLSSVCWKQSSICQRNPKWSLCVKATLKHCGGCTVTQADRGENQSMNNWPKYNKGDLIWQRGKPERKSKVSSLPVSPYYTTLDCTWTHYSVRTDPTLCGPLTDSGCMYASYFTSMVTPEVKVEWSSEMGAEFQPRGGVGSGTAEVWDGVSPDTLQVRQVNGMVMLE